MVLERGRGYGRRSFLSLLGRGIFGALGSIVAAVAVIALSNLDTGLPSKAIATENLDLEQLIRQTTVRILGTQSSGSGVIVQRRGQVYTVLSSWHVFAFSDRPYLLTPDGRRQSFLEPPRQLGTTDLAIARFRSDIAYRVAPLSQRPVVVGEGVYAAGFPMYFRGTVATTFEAGVQGFRLTQGEVSLLLRKSLAQGYRLGYTNDIETGMSGGPIFSDRGFLVGINGRLRNRDPDFGVYVFEDGSEPAPALLAQILRASWGIPIDTYLQLA